MIKMALPLAKLQPQFSKIVQACLWSRSLQQCSFLMLSQTSPYLQQVASMSRYSDKYMEPILDKEELLQGLADDDPRRHRPIIATGTDYHISPLFYDPEIQKFTNLMMKSGNKERVRLIMQKLFENIKHIQIGRYNKAETDQEKAEIECNPVTIFKQAVENCKPLLLTKKVVKGGVAYNVPVSARALEQRFRAMKWIIESCRDKERRIPMEDKLTIEIMDAFNHKGKAMRKKQEIHKICESNRAYAHLRS